MYFHPTENQKREVETENQKDGWKQLTRACALIGFHPFAFGSFGFHVFHHLFSLGWKYNGLTR